MSSKENEVIGEDGFVTNLKCHTELAEVRKDKKKRFRTVKSGTRLYVRLSVT